MIRYGKLSLFILNLGLENILENGENCRAFGCLKKHIVLNEKQDFCDLVRKVSLETLGEIVPYYHCARMEKCKCGWVKFSNLPK